MINPTFCSATVFFEQGDNLGLDRYVQGRGGFVGNEELGIPAQSHGNDDALLQAP